MAGWLQEFMTRYVEAHDAEAVRGRIARVLRPWSRDTKNTAKRWIYWSLHKRGVAYGLPLARPELLQRVQSGDWAEAFEPFLSIWCDLMLEVEAIARGRVREQGVEGWVLCCLAMLVERDKIAVELHTAMEAGELPPRLLGRACRVIEGRLASRRYAAGNPLLGLPLRNGLVYADARMVGRIALTLVETGRIDAEIVGRLRDYFERERRLQIAAMCALVARGTPLPPEARKIAAGQLGELGLPRAQVRQLRHLLDAPPAVSELVRRVEGRRTAGYLVEQVLLAAVIDGLIDSGERAFVDELARHLEVSPRQQARIERRVTLFVEYHRDLFDLFTETQYYGRLGSYVNERVGGLVQANLDALVTEIRQTGELAGLLAKAAGGQSLDKVERAKVREQLLDIVRAVPSLALFSLPGGALLLPIVLRLLPWDLRPSAFRKLGSRRR